MLMSERRYCHNCDKVFHGDAASNFCSINCEQKYNLDKAKWEKLKREKEQND